jgi:hypothetical protein
VWQISKCHILSFLHCRNAYYEKWCYISILQNDFMLSTHLNAAYVKMLFMISWLHYVQSLFIHNIFSMSGVPIATLWNLDRYDVVTLLFVFPDIAKEISYEVVAWTELATLQLAVAISAHVVQYSQQSNPHNRGLTASIQYATNIGQSSLGYEHHAFSTHTCWIVDDIHHKKPSQCNSCFIMVKGVWSWINSCHI